jgi:outer membrane protein
MSRSWTAVALLAGAALLAAPAGAAPREPTLITFPEAVSIALRENVSLRLSENSVILDRAAVSDATMRFFPDLRFGVSATKRFGLGSDGSSSTGADLSSGVVLFDGLGNVARLREARLQEEAGLLEFDRARQTVVFQVVTGYLAMIESAEQERVQTENLAAQEEQETLVRALVEEGERPISDLYQQQSAVASARLAVVEARRTRELAQLELEQVLELDPRGLYTFVIPPVPEVAADAAPVDRFVLVDRAIEARSDLAASSLRLEAAGQGVRAAASDRWPSVSLSAGYGTGATNASEAGFEEQLDTGRSGSVGLSLSVPVFDRFATRNNVARARVAAANAGLTRRDLEVEVAAQVRRAVLDRNAALERLRAAEARVAAAEQALELQRARYEAGAATLVEVTLARADLTAAESVRVNARYTLLWQDRLIDYHVGVLDPSRGLETPGD